MSETMTEPAPPKQKQAAKDPNRVPVSWLLFHEAMDFPSQQESNVKCLPEPAPHGRSYVCSYVKDLNSFELKCCVNGDETATIERMIPRERVKQWVRG